MTSTLPRRLALRQDDRRSRMQLMQRFGPELSLDFTAFDRSVFPRRHSTMSDNYIHIIPEQAGFLPEAAGREAALSYLRTIAPNADDLQVIVSRQLRFVDAGGNSGEIHCPACGKEMDLSRWQQWMNADFSKTGFRLRAHLMPCCGARYTLHELAYEWPLG